MKNKLRLLLLSFLFLKSTFAINAQAPDWLWSKGFGSANMDLLSSIAVDTSGYIYATGYFRDTVDFDPGSGTVNLVSNGNEDIFICKLNSGGDLIWAKSIGGTDYDWGYSIKLDHSGHILLTGFFTGTVDFNPDTAVYNLTSAGFGDIFVTKLDDSGNLIWAKSMGGTTSDNGASLAIDDSDNVYTTGTFFGTADFDPDTSVFNLTSTGELEIFVSKLDSSGNFKWADKFGGTEDDQGYSIALDASANVYTTGYFEKTVDFDPGVDTFNLTAGFLPDVFISKLDRNGNFVWAKSLTGVADNDGYSITVDNAGYVYVTGAFNGTVDYDPDTLTNYNLTSAGGYDSFISKLDSAGNFVWAKSIGGTDDDQSFYISLDDSANVYTSGIFRSTADMDPDPGTLNNVTAAGGFDMYVSKLDSSGNFIWAKANGGSSRDQGNVIIPDAIGNIYVAGYFYSPTLPFDAITLTNADPSTLNSDMFIARLGDFSTGIETLKQTNGISVYPNPASNSLSIELPSLTKEATIRIIDMTGKTIYSEDENGKQFVNLTIDLPEGIYLLQVTTTDFTETKKLIVGKVF